MLIHTYIHILLTYANTHIIHIDNIYIYIHMLITYCTNNDTFGAADSEGIHIL